jgi:hypothetical protein
MKNLSLSFLGNLFAKVIPGHRLRAQALSSLNFERAGGQTAARFCPTLEILEDRTMPSLIASQVLPFLLNTATTNTVTVLAPALSASSPTPQLITLRDTIPGAGTGGTVTFTLPGGGTVTAPVVNGVAQITIPILAGTPAGTVTAAYSVTPGIVVSTSSGAGNGTLTFCGPDSASTLLGPNLRTFAVLGGAGVTNTGNTVIAGNVGTPLTLASITGFPPGVVLPPSSIITGPLSTAATAEIELANDITSINLLAPGPTQGPAVGPYIFANPTQDLSGLTLTPGVYKFNSNVTLTGTLTLNDENNPAALFVFQIPNTLITSTGSRVMFINGGADNVYWDVGNSASLPGGVGTPTVFAGNILALHSIQLGATTSIACGRALAETASVTLIDNFIDPAPQGQGGTLSFRLSQLRLDHGFHFVGSYYQNSHGANEKWFQDRDNQWWALTPNGDLIKWDGKSFASSRQNANTTVHLSQYTGATASFVFDDPNLLFNASVVLPASLLSELSQLRLDHGFHFVGSYYQNCDGANEKWFQDRDNQWWALTPNGDLIKWDGKSFASSRQNANTTVHLSQYTGATAPLVFDDPNLLFKL